MSDYLLNKTNGQFYANIKENSIDTTTPLKYVGQKVKGYGEFQNENFLHLLENFTSEVQPQNPVTGQLWFNNVQNSVKVCIDEKNNTWQSLTLIYTAQPNSEESEEGMFYWDNAQQQLLTYTGGEWVVIASSAVYPAETVPVADPSTFGKFLTDDAETVKDYLQEVNDKATNKIRVWADAVKYIEGDVVQYKDCSFVCIVGHESYISFTTQLFNWKSLSSNMVIFEEPSHSYSLLESLYFDASAQKWEKGLSNNKLTLSTPQTVVIGHDDNFVLALRNGDVYVDGLNMLIPTLNVGETYYLSDTVAGGYSLTYGAKYINPVFKAIDNYSISVASLGVTSNVDVLAPQVGDVKSSMAITLDGWIPMTGGTIGLSSGTYFGPDYYEVYMLLAQNVSGKTELQAESDWASNIGIAIPNANGKTLVGAGSAGGDIRVLGEIGGEEEHTLTVDEMPSHEHDLRTVNANDINNGSLVPNTDDGSFVNTANNVLSTGGDLPHNNMQPFYTVNYFIKY